jgi:LPS export ABC transporter protein LptC
MSDYDRQSVLEALADTSAQGSETWNIRMDIMEDQRRMISINSPYAITTESRDGNTTEMHGPVYIEVRDSSGVTQTVVQANKARYYSRAGEFHLEGNVRILTDGDRRLYSETLLWFQHNRSIETPDFVRIYTPTDSIAGFGLTGDDQLQTYVISRVTGTFLLDSRRDTPASGE